jgi:misacylated tRNA(Ala) deacylase
MARALYMDDSYLKTWNAKVVSVKDDKYVVLDKTAFYPKGGGQPWDEGFIIRDDQKYEVVYVGKFSGKISHEVDKPGLEE